MKQFTVIEKDSLDKIVVNANRITLSEASIVHTKMYRQDVAEFLRDGNNLILKLNNGEEVVIENFFVQYENVESDLVFEEDGCVLYWFDEVAGFKEIAGLEDLLPIASESATGGILPWVAGALAAGGIAAAIIDHNDNDNKLNDGTINLQINNDGTISGVTKDVTPGSKVIVTVEGLDKDGNIIKKDIETTINSDGSYQVNIPVEIVDGSAVNAVAQTTDQNGKVITADDHLPGAIESGSDGGLDRVESAITVDIVETGSITGTTTDVAPGTDVVLTITGKDANGNDVTVTKTVTTDASGNYTSALTPADGIVD
ncbi:BapA prefix-like domain-containing protein, partial [Acinetobacter sp. S40]|uniref:BapA/Bap/LapF family prefix-like domain-containing protein n=1 Tax=Acinetobacter sp. S40 TaxID=2767434 RepID=UPI00190CA952